MAIHPAYRGRPVVSVRDLGTGKVFRIRMPETRLQPRPVPPMPAAVPPADEESFVKVASRRIQEITIPTPSYPLVSFDPYVFPPKEAIEIDRYVQGTVPIGITVPSSLVFNVPDKHVGVLRWFGNYTPVIPTAGVNGPPPLGVYFTLRLNEAPVYPYARVYLSLGAIEDPTKIFVRIPPQSKIDIQISNETAAVQTIAARFKGWYWPEGAIVNRQVLEDGGPVAEDEGGML